MISFKTISSFRSRLSGLLSVRCKVYVNVENEIKREFAGKPIEQIRQNNDMILLEGDLIIIKLRLPDKKQHLSRKDGYRLIYLVSKTDEIVVFLDIYPKNGPLQQLASHTTNCFSKSSPCGPIPHKNQARALMPRQPYSAAVKSDRRSGYIPCPFGKGEGLGVG